MSRGRVGRSRCAASGFCLAAAEFSQVQYLVGDDAGGISLELRHFLCRVLLSFYLMVLFFNLTLGPILAIRLGLIARWDYVESDP